MSAERTTVSPDEGAAAAPPDSAGRTGESRNEPLRNLLALAGVV